MKWELSEFRDQTLSAQIAANVRRAIADGTLSPCERLPPARELAPVLGVDPNTVLVAYRRLRDEDLLTFGRGRSVRVHPNSAALASVRELAEQLVELGRRRGYTADELTALVASVAVGRSTGVVAS